MTDDPERPALAASDFTRAFWARLNVDGIGDGAVATGDPERALHALRSGERPITQEDELDEARGGWWWWIAAAVGVLAIVAGVLL